MVGIVTGMMVKDFVAETCTVNMNVYFSSSNAFVTEHLLDSTQIGATLKKMGRKGMTEGMG